MNDTRTVFFVGKPGSGKGTQAKFLAEHTGWPILASGKMFREIAAEDTPVGHKIKEETTAGLLAPHWFAMYLYQKALFSLPEGTNVIFDGFNRKIPEAELIISSLSWLERPFSVIYIAVSDEVVRSRLSGRKEHSGRADDFEVDTRLEEYYEYTDRAIEVFRNAGVLIEIDGEQPAEKIAEDVRMALHLS